MRTVLQSLLLITSLVARSQGSEVPLGSGHRGLIFTQLRDGRNYTVAFAYNVRPDFLLSAGFGTDADSKIILKETLTPEYVSTFPGNFWAGWRTIGLFSFDQNTAFDGRDLYRIEDGHIRIYPHQAGPEARKRYSLQENQIFLGAFDQRVFYWEKDKPRVVYFKTENENKVFSYTLHKRVTEPLGMSKGNPKGDLALRAVVKPKGWYPSPRTFEWIVLNVKDAKLVKSISKD
jgi:hypothetical protein